MKNNVKVISLAKFLNKYVSLCGEDLKKLTHEDVQILFPYFKRSSFDKIYNNPTLVSSGKVVLVNDGKKTIPYYAPQTLYLDDDYTDRPGGLCSTLDGTSDTVDGGGEMDDRGLKMPDEFTEFSYEDGELSGSGHKRWSSEDTYTVLKWTGAVTGIVGFGLVCHRIWSGHWIWQSCSRADPQPILNDINDRHEGGNDPPVPDQINVENEEGDRGSKDAVQQAYLFIINDFYNEGRMEVAR
jgi:hypothetical protein